jgi:protein-S-isoprenylcysteine O-methyltransferase Ste14
MSSVIYTDIMGLSWLAFIIYWVISSIGIKRDISRIGPVWLSVGVRVLIGLTVFLLLQVPFVRTVVRQYIDRFSLAHPAVGAVLCVAGIGLAIWARTILGRNWSGRPAVKEGHELITSGPYHVVRHPIYSGMLTAMLGTFFIAGIPGLLVLIAFSAIVIYRIGIEERLMVQLFAEKYLEYKKRTKALIPFIL